MADATVSGSITYSLSPNGPSVSMVLGSPTASDSTAMGAITYNEKSEGTAIVTSAAPVTIPMGTVSSGAVLYIGASQQVTVILNGGAETITVNADGFIMIGDGAITGATVQAVALDATVQYLILGD